MGSVNLKGGEKLGTEKEKKTVERKAGWDSNETSGIGSWTGDKSKETGGKNKDDK